MQVLLNRADLLPEVAADSGVQSRERFIKQENPGFCHEGARQGHALLLAARELMGVLLFVPRQFHQSDGVSDLFRCFRGRHPVHFEAESDVFRGRHVGKKRIALKHHADAALLGLDVGDVGTADINRPGVRRFKAREAPQKR